MKFFAFAMLWLVAFPAHADSPQRVITIGGAVTEIVYALDKGELLVGSDTSSYYPEAAEQLPKVGYQRALSAEGVLSLKPNLVILTDQAGPPPVIAQIKQAGINVLILESNPTIAGVVNNISQVGQAVNAAEKAGELTTNIETNMSQLQQSVQQQVTKPTAMFILQHGGGAPMVAGTDTAANGIMALAGIQNVATEYSGYKPLTPESAASLAPDILLVTNQGLEQAGGKDAMLKTPSLALTPAGKNKHIIVMDSLLLLGFGPRTAEAAKQLHTSAQAL